MVDEFRARSAVEKPLPSLDLLVPTRDRHDCLRRSLASWRIALGTQGRLILCDQSAQPFAAEGVEVLHRPDLRGLPAARNALLAASRAEIVVFLDDDCALDPGMVSAVRRLARDEPGMLAWGPVVERRGLWTRRAHRLVHLGAFHDPRRQVDGPCNRATGALFGCCFAVRRAAAIAVGFDARRHGYALGEDLDFFRRLGTAFPQSRLRFAKVLRAVHRQDGADRADALRRGQAKGAFLGWLARRHGAANPATPLHLALAVLAAASGYGQEPAAWHGVLDGLVHGNGHGQPRKNRAP